MINPIDKDKVAENPGLIAYPHHIGSIVVKPEDVGKLKSRALSAMQEQTQAQLAQIKKQVELLMDQATQIQKRVEISEKIYSASMSFEPFVGNVYHLYQRDNAYVLMLIAQDEWGRAKPENLIFISSVRLLSDHTWEIL
ncbi:MAG: DUF2452 domain-containing protein [Bacteroidia bacterium]|jgi:hypothetical protein|nr:DUF2452 domain-containing protein [Bacteroidia bacterium]